MVEVSGYLEWDSKFFNKRIAFIDGFKATDTQISKEVDKFYNVIRTAYIFIPVDRSICRNTILSLLTKNGFMSLTSLSIKN